MIWIFQYGLVMKWCNYFCVVFQMVKWSNGEPIFLGTNGEMVKSWYGEMVICYDGLNMSIWFGGEILQLFSIFFLMKLRK